MTACNADWSRNQISWILIIVRGKAYLWWAWGWVLQWAVSSWLQWCNQALQYQGGCGLGEPYRYTVRQLADNCSAYCHLGGWNPEYQTYRTILLLSELETREGGEVGGEGVRGGEGGRLGQGSIHKATRATPGSLASHWYLLSFFNDNVEPLPVVVERIDSTAVKTRRSDDTRVVYHVGGLAGFTYYSTAIFARRAELWLLFSRKVGSSYHKCVMSLMCIILHAAAL